MATATERSVDVGQVWFIWGKHQQIVERAGSMVAEPRDRTTAAATHPPNEISRVVARTTHQDLYLSHSAGYWNWRYRARTQQLKAAHRRIHNLKRTLMASPSVTEAINLACVVYGSCSTLWALARCESTLNPRARNPSSSATGLYQILHPSTWRTTPFAGFDVYSPYANSMAAGYMISHGRRSEWVC